MTTPLQVTILSLLLERRVRAPQDRYALFDGYYTAVYEREVGKDTAVALILDQHRSHVHALHEQVGVQLQARSEHAGEAEAALTGQELRRLAVARLLRDEYSMTEAEQLAGRLVDAAIDRLVLLVGLTAGTIGFEIRSLQEFMAARAVAQGSGADVLHRLRVLATATYWRNTWLFAAGRLFTEREHLRDSVIALLEDLDTAGNVEMLVAPGARLAAQFLKHDVGINSPKYRRLLTKRALALMELFPHDMRDLIEFLHPAAVADPDVRRMVIATIDRALAGHTRSTLCALRVLYVWSQSAPSPLEATCKLRLARYEARHRVNASAVLRADATDPDPATIHRDLRRIADEHVPEHDFDAEIHEALGDLLTDPRLVDLMAGRLSEQHAYLKIEGVPAGFHDTLAELVNSLPVDLWRPAETLARMLRSNVSNRPVADELLRLMPR